MKKCKFVKECECTGCQLCKNEYELTEEALKNILEIIEYKEKIRE